jgi:glycogen synthase
VDTRAVDSIDFRFHTKLRSWAPRIGPFLSAFDEQQRALLHQRAEAFDRRHQTIVLLCLENRLAALGGLATIMRHLPAELQSRGERVIVLSPLYGQNPRVKQALKQGELEQQGAALTMTLGAESKKVKIFKDTTLPWPTFQIQLPGYCSARHNPYDYVNQEQLLLDSLAFCQSIPEVMGALGQRDNLIFHAQDWECAAIAPTALLGQLCNQLGSCRTMLTLHNSFDCALSPRLQQQFWGRTVAGETVLQSCIPLLSAPLSTVSEPFARELRQDPLQNSIFIPHLQEHLAQNPPIGINNGLFGTSQPPFSPPASAAAAQGDFAPLLRQKHSRTKAALTLLASLNTPQSIGSLTMPPRGSRKIPLFFMAGRLDMSQKGFDVIFDAFSQLVRGRAKLIFSPTLTSSRATATLDFFKRHTSACSGDIIMLPYRLDGAAYHSLLQGASFLLMPSFYEPFGAATEGYLQGTAVVARATGGLISQVSEQPAASGILFREAIEAQEAAQQWPRLLALPSSHRHEVPLYRSMVAAAKHALEQACAVYASDDHYGAMLSNGAAMLPRFSWSGAAERYQKLYDCAITRAIP